MESWRDAAQAAEDRGDWDEAIALVSAVAECHSADYMRHDDHLWHMDLLVKAERLEELAVLAESDNHARRRLDRYLREQRRDQDLRIRAEHGDRYALYLLVRLLCEQGDDHAARQAIADIDADNSYALELVDRAARTPE